MLGARTFSVRCEDLWSSNGVQCWRGAGHSRCFGEERGLACPTPHYKACVFRANFYQIDPSPAVMGVLSIQPPFTRAVRRVVGPISRQRLLPVLGVAEKRQPLFSNIPSNFAQRSCSISHSSQSGETRCASEARCPRFCIYGPGPTLFSRIPLQHRKPKPEMSLA